MAAKARFPQIPSTVWWGVRNLLQKSPKATIDTAYLSADLNVQEAAANAYIGELKFAGLLTDEGKATELALKWRLDDSYEKARLEIVENVYPDSLRQITTQNPSDRTKISNWFMNAGLGEGAARNKTATFLLINSELPQDGAASKPRPSGDNRREKTSSSKPKNSLPAAVPLDRKNGTQLNVERIPLNVNVQIHISADAGQDQINAIFSAMKRYLKDDEDN